MTSTTAPTQFSYPAADGLDIVAYRWDPAGPPRGIVQITHGVGEHVLRYAYLAEQLTERGFVVYGQDHRGHGATAQSEEAQGQIGPDGWDGLINDIDLLVTHARDSHPDLPLALVAHSLGSFAVQQYLPDHSDRMDAVVFTGTAALDLLEPAIDLDAEVELSAFNAPFLPARTDFDWLSRDEGQVDAYVDDPRCGFGLDIPAFKAVFAGAREIADPQRLASIRSDLPIYIAVGEADPLNGQLALVHAMVGRYEAAGLTDVTLKTYPEARHEIFNETNRDEVVADLVSWLDRVVPRPG